MSSHFYDYTEGKILKLLRITKLQYTKAYLERHKLDCNIYITLANLSKVLIIVVIVIIVIVNGVVV